MVSFTELYFAGKLAVGVIGIILNLILIIIMWVNGAFKK